MMAQATKYACRCGATKWLPEDPLRPAPSIRTGCPDCGRIKTFRPVGSIHSWNA